MVALHQRCFHATVFVAGGQNRPDTCPFQYTYIDAGSEVAARQRLASSLLPFDVVIYHWIPGWAQAAIRDAGVPSIEVVHREDTSDNDKTIPTLIVTHSEYLAAFLRTHYGVEARVISHGVDTDRFQPASPEPESESDGRPVSSYVGAITSYLSLKGVDLFLSAWAAIQHKYPQYQSRFYGSGPELTSLRTQAAHTGLSGRVEILGPTSHPEAHLSEYRLFVVPSRAEGMPFAVLEALAANVPVLASDLAPMQEFNEIAVTRGCSAPLVLFERDNLSDLIEKLDACLGSQSTDREDTRSYISRYFSLEDHCQQYESAMEQAVALHAELASPVAPKRD
jgi:glycosyltransferase involved in cell wall biosynthesis